MAFAKDEPRPDGSGKYSKAAKRLIAKARKPKRPAARKGADGQEQVIELAPLKRQMIELIALYGRKGEAAQAFGDAVKVAAEASGLQSSTVRKFVTARAGEQFDKAKRGAEQLQLLFEEVGA